VTIGESKSNNPASSGLLVRRWEIIHCFTKVTGTTITAAPPSGASN
jgi:hypothetical protein